jgi:hypothetical protein
LARLLVIPQFPASTLRRSVHPQHNITGEPPQVPESKPLGFKAAGF